MAAYTAGFMTHVACKLTAKNRDQPRNPTLGNRVWATFTFFYFVATLMRHECFRDVELMLCAHL